MNSRTTMLLCLALTAGSGSAQHITLAEGLRLAMSNRGAIRAAADSVEQARHTRRALGAFPATTLGAGASSPSTLGATDQDLFIEQPLDVFGRARASRRLGDAAVLRAESYLRETQLRVQSDVLEQFARATAASEALAVGSVLRELAAQLHSATARRFEEGKVPEIQVSRSRIELERATLAASDAEAVLLAALRSLSGAVGLEAVEGTSGAFNVVPQSGTDVSQRPDLLAFRAEVVASIAEERIAAMSQLPELSLLGLRSPWSDDRGRFGARIQLTWTIWDDRRGMSERGAATARRKAAESSHEDARRRAEADLAAVDKELEAVAGRIESLARLLAATRRLVELSQIGFREGVGTQIDVIEATRSLRELEQEAIAARLTHNLAITRRLAISGQVLEPLR